MDPSPSSPQSNQPGKYSNTPVDTRKTQAVSIVDAQSPRADAEMSLRAAHTLPLAHDSAAEGLQDLNAQSPTKIPGLRVRLITFSSPVCLLFSAVVLECMAYLRSAACSNVYIAGARLQRDCYSCDSILNSMYRHRLGCQAQ